MADESQSNQDTKPTETENEKPEIAPKPVQPEEQNASVEEYIGTQIEPVSVDTGIGSEKEEEKSEKIDEKSDTEQETNEDEENHKTGNFNKRYNISYRG